jgi:copper transport protein
VRRSRPPAGSLTPPAPRRNPSQEEIIHSPFRRAAARAALVVLVALPIALATAPSAAAHAVLESTNPPNDAVVAASPPRVVLRFDEPVETAFGSVRVFDDRGDRVDHGDISRPSGDSVAVAVGRLARGTYTVAWRVISADTHPVHGAFAFSVGAASGNPERIAARVLQQQGTPASISVGFAVVRFGVILLLLLVGGSALAAVALPRGDRRLDLVLAAGAGALALLSFSGLVYQGADAGGYGLGRALSGESLSTVLDSRFGVVWLVRACVAAALAAVLLAASRRSRAALVPLRALLGVALIATGSLAGHASAAGGFTLAADIVHLAAAAVWTGGLLYVVLALAFAGRTRWEFAAVIVPRFSLLAAGSVALLLAAGVVGGYIEVRSWHGLFTTTYGQLVLAKAALVLPLLALGAYNNRYAVPRLRGQIASAVEQRRFLRAAVAEIVLIAAVIGVTAVLVAKPPPKASAATTTKAASPYATTTELGPYELNLVVDPALAGHNAVHLYLLRPSGLPGSATGATVLATLEQPQLGPFRIPMLLLGPGHFGGYAHLAIAGNWRLRVEIRRGKFDQWATTLTVPIGGF